ncbi:response regulator transcription factor [Amycolatopsis sp. YIM 10]|uniref:response regulator transcription factor n=1 Tax=Amycolatopsis sp. YIM 10 TaxID=2653857 RepID=UPI00129088E3|nr:LuxR C-terminal-related transcriptional regulator [Amycolatopsis sp. YIM 10]QFU93027.1 Oxygen regulatory protein NreC [Amycolatopsis sp. YIM 10]
MNQESSKSISVIAGAGVDIRILVVGQNEVVRRGIEAMLHSIANVRDVLSCTGFDEAGRLIGAHRPDVLVAGLGQDPGLPPLLERARHAHTKILLLMRDPGEAELSAIAQLPGDGYLVEEELTVPVLEDTLHRLLVDQVPMPSAMARELLHRAGRAETTAPPPRREYRSRLTRRELQALSLLVEGMSNKQIARGLAISDHAVKRVMASMLVKLNCANRTQAVALALKGGLAGAGTR